MTGPEHHAEAERLARFAEDLYLDNGDDVLTREEYASDDEFHAAVAESNEAHEQAVTEMAAFAQLAQVHATLAAAATIPTSDQ